MKTPKYKKKSNPIARDLMTSKYKPKAVPNKKIEQKKSGTLVMTEVIVNE
jgi:hypothetical protein